jgi:ankyrin repeat protein
MIMNRLPPWAWLVVLAAVPVGAATRVDPALPAAAQSGDRAAVARLLWQGADPASPGADGTTALHWAVYRDDAAMTGLVLAAGSAVDAVNRNGMTALSLACTNANAAIVEQLLAAGADPHRAPNGEPPILTCARTGNPVAVAALLDHGAAVDARETWRCQTPLMWAAAEGHAAVVELLLSRGADVDAVTEEGGFTALTFAVRQGALESARLLIDAGADVDVQATTTGESLLQVAIKNRHYSIAELLLERGANPRAADKGGRTALHALVTARGPVNRERAPGIEDTSDGLDLMRALLAAGADPDAMTSGLPKLSDALVPSAIRPIIDNAVNTGGSTPLLLAAQAADAEAMRVLLAGGADPLASTYGGTTALMLAAGLVFVEGSQRFRPESDALEAVRLALESGVDVNAVNEHGQTALHGAVYRAANTIIAALIDAGARTDLADERGRTPLALAEQGFNQVASVIRRERAAELLRRFESERPAGPTRQARLP